MLKETRTYKDFDGKERTEDFYFNLSKAELMELEASVDGGWLNSMKRIISAQNNPAIMREFKKYDSQQLRREEPGREAVYQESGAFQGFLGDGGLFGYVCGVFPASGSCR